MHFALIPLLALGTFAQSPSAVISNGTVIGRSSGGLDSFYGIPFAQPPTGTRRLKGPQPIVSSFGTIMATSVPNSCPNQNASLNVLSLPPLYLVDYQTSPNIKTETEASPGTSFDQGEDCLTLNVHRPAGVSAGANLPVLFWIYGGGYEAGSDQGFDGALLINRSKSLDQKIIFVAANYRLSAFGWLAGAELQRDGSTNLGMRDQRAALAWVQENIAQFGGDASRVTIMGESAGSWSAFNQLLVNGGDNSYGSGGSLFQGAIMDSGMAFPAGSVSSAGAQETYDAVVHAAGCSGSSDSLQCLREVDYETFLAASNSQPSLASFQTLDLVYLARPDNSSDFYPMNPYEALDGGHYAKVPIIAGNQEDEGTLFALFASNVSDTADVVNYFRKWFPAASADAISGLAAAYANTGSPFRTGILNEMYPEFKRMAAIIGDFAFIMARRASLGAMTSELPAVYSYLSSYYYGTAALGTAHGSDLALLFKGDGPSVPQDALLTYYVSFVNHLDPNAISQPKSIGWPKYTLTGSSPRQMLLLNAGNGSDEPWRLHNVPANDSRASPDCPISLGRNDLHRASPPPAKHEIPLTLPPTLARTTPTVDSAAASRKGTRVAHRRSRNGCVACKKRHVRCDEGKPSCSMCLDSGRTCLGYVAPEPIVRGRTHQPFRGFRYMTAAVAGPSRGPSTASTLRPLEARTFDFFIKCTLPVWRRHFPSGSWIAMVVGIQEVQPVVRQCCIAVGALHAQMTAVAARSAADTTDVSTALPLQTYVGAVRDLRMAIAAGTIPHTALVLACLLLTFNASLRGARAEMLIHLRTGLSVLERRVQSQARSSDDDQSALMLTQMGMHQLLHSRPRLESSPEMQALLARVVSSSSADGDSFTDMAGASRMFAAISREAFIWAHRVESKLFPSAIALTSERSSLIARLDRWHFAFEQHVEKCALLDPRSPEREDVLLLRIQFEMAMTFVLAYGHGGQMSFDAHMDRMERIVAYADDFLPKKRPPQDTVFSFNTGLISILFTLAIVCRQPTVRRKALNLLLRTPRHEGVWDSRNAFKIATKIMQIEEYDTDVLTVGKAAAIPQHKRVRKVDVEDVQTSSGESCQHVVVIFQEPVDGLEDDQKPNLMTFEIGNLFYDHKDLAIRNKVSSTIGVLGSPQ